MWWIFIKNFMCVFFMLFGLICMYTLVLSIDLYRTYDTWLKRIIVILVGVLFFIIGLYTFYTGISNLILGGIV